MNFERTPYGVLIGESYLSPCQALDLLQWLAEQRDALQGQAARDRQLAAGSPVLAVLGTDLDTAYDWLIAGQALARVLLYARSQEIWASFLNQPIEVPEVRLMLHNLIERGGFPQLLLRMGYGPKVPPTPRRSVCEVLL